MFYCYPQCLKQISQFWILKRIFLLFYFRFYYFEGGGVRAPSWIFQHFSLQAMFKCYPPSINQISRFWVQKRKFWPFSYGISIILKRGGFGGPLRNCSKFFFTGHVLVLSSMHKPNFTVLGLKTKILAMFLWSFYYFDKGLGGLGAPLKIF